MIRKVGGLAALLLAGCVTVPGVVDTAPLPRKPTTSPPAVLRPTPFAPIAPTSAAPIPAAASVAAEPWPAPNSYGRWGEPAVPIPPPAEPLSFPAGTLNVMLLGSDRRSGRGFRTDTLVLASIQPGEKMVALVSIPRDLYVYLPGNGVARINSAWIYGQAFDYPGGGPQLLMDTIRYNFGVPIQHYALVEMDGFRRILDALGGVDVRVACRYTDWWLRSADLPEQAESSWDLFTVLPGVIHMDGEEALWYARARLHSTDFDRTRRQQEVLRAAYRVALHPDVLARIPSLYESMRDAVVTDLTLEDLLALAPFAAHLGPVNLRSRFIGHPQVTSWRVPSSGAAVLLPDAAAIRRLLEEAFTPAPEESPAGTLHVEIEPGARPDLEALAQERLLYAGIDATVREASPGDASTTRLWVAPGAAREDVARLVAILGLKDSALEVDQEAKVPNVFRLSVGGDYNPCFDPAAIVAP